GKRRGVAMARVEDNGRADGAGEFPRPRRMRARRLRMTDLKLDEVRARFRHRLLGAVDGVVEDVSLHGMAVVVPGGAQYQDLLATGDRIDDLAITGVASTAGGDDGSAVVRRVTQRDADLVL